MTVEQAPAPAAQANPQGLMPIGAVAAHNIAAALSMPKEAVGEIETAIRDEINAMSSHFTMAVADVQTQYESELLKLKNDYAKAVAAVKADFVWVKANKAKIAFGASLLIALGLVAGHLF